MDIFDKVMIALLVAAGVTCILFIWALGYAMLVQVGVL